MQILKNPSPVQLTKKHSTQQSTFRNSTKSINSSFVKCKTEQAPEITQTFDEQFFADLIIWEETFYCHKLSQSGVDLLIQAYGRLVEYFDSRKDPLKRYFLDKLQFTLSRPQIIRKIINKAEGNTKCNNPQKVQVNESVIECEQSKFSEVSIGNKECSFTKKQDQQLQKKNIDRSPSYKGRALERAFNLKQQLMAKDQSEKRQLHILMESFQDLSERLETFKQNEIQRQDEIFQEKISTRIKSIESSAKNSAQKNKGFLQMKNLLGQGEKYFSGRKTDRMGESIASFRQN